MERDASLDATGLSILQRPCDGPARVKCDEVDQCQCARGEDTCRASRPRGYYVTCADSPIGVGLR